MNELLLLVIHLQKKMYFFLFICFFCQFIPRLFLLLFGSPSKQDKKNSALLRLARLNVSGKLR